MQRTLCMTERMICSIFKIKRHLVSLAEEMLMKNIKSKGFTLIELMITIAVLAILAAIALPSFQGTLERRQLVGAAENLYADLQSF